MKEETNKGNHNGRGKIKNREERKRDEEQRKNMRKIRQRNQSKEK